MSTEPENQPVPADETHNKALPLVVSEIRGWIRDVFFAVGTAILIVIFLYQPVKVEGTSMLPELMDQERIFVNKFVYRFGKISRQDIVVFWYPRDPTKSYIKRIIGMPGDTVEIRRGVVYVNGEALDEPYILPEYMDQRSMDPRTSNPVTTSCWAITEISPTTAGCGDWFPKNTSTAKRFSDIGR